MEPRGCNWRQTTGKASGGQTKRGADQVIAPPPMPQLPAWQREDA